MIKQTKVLVLILAMIACILACVSGCRVLIMNRSDSTDSTNSAEVTERMTPTPTKKPTPTPTPTPASVYIPREELPDGRLFEEGYYAVLPGEGAFYNVFDCNGQQIGSFPFSDGESIPPSGLLTEKGLSDFHRLNESDVQIIVPVGEYGENYLNSNENGFYQINYDERQVILYNTVGKHIRTLNSPGGTDLSFFDIVVACYGEETVVSFTSSNWEKTSFLTAIYFVALDGKINDLCFSKDLPNRVDGLLGRKYFLVDQGAWDRTSCDVYDMDSNLIMQNVSAMESFSLVLCSYEASTLIYISDYYMKDEKTYNASLQAVEKNTVAADGDLIYGVEYDVEGISCMAEYWKQTNAYDSYTREHGLIAVGTSGDQMAIKTRESEYVITCNDFKYYDMNEHLLVLSDSYGTFQVISLDTGEVLHTINNSQQVHVTDEYLLIDSSEYDEDWWPQVQYIIDKNGSIRYFTQNSHIQITSGENIILRRGPYQGIADLNGDWIIKTLTWEMTRDDVYVDPWA
jgi:hypothetical protein